jgi:malonyl CoA-acyl carrier protein transacylase
MALTKLTDTRFAQPALLTSSIAALEALREQAAAAGTASRSWWQGIR